MSTAPLSLFTNIFNSWVLFRHLILREVHSSSPALLTRKGPLKSTLLLVRLNLTLWHILSLMIVHRPCPHFRSSLPYRTIHYCSLLSYGTFRGEPATRQFDWSFATTPRSYDRFERQIRFALPPAFPQASSCPGIAHCLSGLTIYTIAHNTARTLCELLGPCFKTGATCCLPHTRFL